MFLCAVIDTNVIVSAFLKASSAPGIVLKESLVGKIIPILNEEIISEYRDVLKRDKFKFDFQKTDDFLQDFTKRGIFVGKANIQEYFPDRDDVVFYAVTMEAKKSYDTYLVTGNIKHFPERFFVVTPRKMIEIINAL